MEKLPICRICLVENVRMFKVGNRNLHELYEKLTDIPFMTQDSRPILACFFCCAKLKQCYRLLQQCLKAEELFAQRMNEDYAPNPLSNQDCLQLSSGFIKSPIEHISIDGEYETGSTAIKRELPAVYEGLDDVIEPKEEHQSDEATVARKPKLDTQRTKEKDAIPAEQTTKDKSDSKVIWTTQKWTSNPGTYFKEPYICIQRNSNQVSKEYKCDVCQRSFSQKSNLSTHIRTHTGVKPYKCDVCQHSFNQKSSLLRHRRTHTGEKPFKCDVCQRNYSSMFYLKQHNIRIHTG